MGVQDLTVQMVVIVVIGVFFASFMDAIAGGGGIISVPTYLLAGLPMHFALGTNKFSSSIGTAFSTGRYIKNGYVDWKLGIPSIVLALIGSFFGTKLQLMISEVYLQYLLLIVLPVVAFVVLRQPQMAAHQSPQGVVDGAQAVLDFVLPQAGGIAGEGGRGQGSGDNGGGRQDRELHRRIPSGGSLGRSLSVKGVPGLGPKQGSIYEHRSMIT